MTRLEAEKLQILSTDTIYCWHSHENEVQSVDPLFYLFETISVAALHVWNSPWTAKQSSVGVYRHRKVFSQGKDNIKWYVFGKMTTTSIWNDNVRTTTLKMTWYLYVPYIPSSISLSTSTLCYLLMLLVCWGVMLLICSLELPIPMINY